MIFNVPGHIDMIRNGLPRIVPCKPILIKTQTRRLNRGIYKVGKDYAVQRKRGVKAEPDIRIVMDRIREEDCLEEFDQEKESLVEYIAKYICIGHKGAWAEGGYTPEEYEKTFLKLNPKWSGWSRWAFQFHVIEVQK